MKFFHLADLHLGKRVNEMPMLEDQAHILAQILSLSEEEKPRAVVIAGDVYDKPAPPPEAVRLFDGFVTELCRQGVAVLTISGNHDSPERLGFLSGILQSARVHTYGVFDGAARVVTLGQGAEAVDFHLLPFLRPGMARPFFPDREIETYHDAVAAALSKTPPVPGRRTVLVAHQFVVSRGIAPERSDSEVGPVGGLDSVDALLFRDYDYVALGHLHGPQQMGGPAVRYAGSPLKYSFSECRHVKSVTVVTMAEGAPAAAKQIPLAPLRDMRKIRGPFADLTRLDVAAQENALDYLHVTLTDEAEILDALDKLRTVYPNVMQLSFDNARTRAEGEIALEPEAVGRTDEALFAEFFALQNGREMTREEEESVHPLLERGDAP